MTPTTGVPSDRYELLDRIGAGGMGEVYRARDRRLNRMVALKALPAAVAGDPVRRARFEREARTIAGLSHPHICALYDVLWQGGREWLVLELVDGETLEERLRSGSLPLRDVLRHGAELAGALDAAHRAGIVHRDLKPSNVMVTSAGVKLLDFGIAKPHSEPGADGTPATTESLTAERHLLGTVRYMSPEQIEGGPVDRRADIFALGAVLYRMCTGADAFGGESTASQIASVLTSDPAPIPERDGHELRSPLLEHLDHVVRRCLAKAPDDRWHSARDVKAELEWIAERLRAGQSRPDPASRRVRLWTGIAVVAGALLVVLGWSFHPRPEPVPEPDGPIAISIPPPPGTRLLPGPLTMALSPDGRHVAFLAADNRQGDTLLWLRDLDATTPHVLPGTDQATRPFWSYDSRYIAFFVGHALKKIAIAGGPPETICETPRDGNGGWPGAWNAEGSILFSPKDHDALWQVPASGGTPAMVTRLDRERGEQWNGYPQFLPDGRHFLFGAGNRDEGRQTINIGALGSSDVVHLFAATGAAQYALPGYLLYVQGVTLLARRFDADQLHVTGDPASLATDVITVPAVNRAFFSVSQTGVLAYRTYPPRRIAWYDREGHLLRTLDTVGSATEPALSPDGQRLAVSRREPGTANSDIWTCDVDGSACAPLTSRPSVEFAPLWTRDGRHLLFSSDRGGTYGIYQRSFDQRQAEELLRSFNRQNATILHDVLPDDRHLIVDGALDDQGTADIVMVDLSDERASLPLFRTRREGGDVRVSPNGRWMAYQSSVSGRDEVFVKAFPDGRNPVKVSTSGGGEPRWRRDGRELYYLAPDCRLMAAAIGPDPEIEVQAPVPLFAYACDGSSVTGHVPAGRNQYDVTANGERFVVSERTEDSPITVVANWPALLRH